LLTSAPADLADYTILG